MTFPSRGCVVYLDLIRRQRSTSYKSLAISFALGTLCGVILCFAILLYGSTCTEGTSCGPPGYAAEPISAAMSPTSGVECDVAAIG